jgi:nitrite reductase (NO-forming)
MNKTGRWLAALVIAAGAGISLPAFAAEPAGVVPHRHTVQTRPGAPPKPAAKPAPAAPKVSKQSPAAEHTPTVRYRLRTELAEGKMAFVGVGGDIEGIVNPTLRGRRRHRAGRPFDVVFPDFKAGTDRVSRKGASSVTVFARTRPASSTTSARCPGTARRAWRARSTWAA